MHTPTPRAEHGQSEWATPTERAAARETIPPDSGIDPDLWLLHVCYAARPDAELRRQLVDEYAGYATSVAHEMHREGDPIDDLRQVAFEGLLLALDRFEPARGYPFLGFASVTIRGRVKRYFRDFGWLMRVPRRVHELSAPIRRAEEELTAKFGRSPNLEELADRVGIDVGTLIEAKEATRARSIGSLVESWDGTEIDIDPRDDSDVSLEDSVDLLDLESALSQLDDDDRELLYGYFVEERTQSELAEMRGVSQMQISRLLQSATRRMAAHMAPVS